MHVSCVWIAQYFIAKYVDSFLYFLCTKTLKQSAWSPGHRQKQQCCEKCGYCSFLSQVEGRINCVIVCAMM